MTRWLWIALISNLVYWGLFAYWCSQKRWTRSGLGVGVLHMLYASLLVVAPIRSFIDPDYPGYQLGILRFERQAAVIPATMILVWALTSAYLAVRRGYGKRLRLIAAGDVLFAVLMGGLFVEEWMKGLLNGPQIQFGEHLTLSGPLWALVPMLVFVLPFCLSAVWAMKRTSWNGPSSGHPLDSPTRQKRRQTRAGSDGGDGFARWQADVLPASQTTRIACDV